MHHFSQRRGRNLITTAALRFAKLIDGCEIVQHAIGCDPAKCLHTRIFLISLRNIGGIIRCAARTVNLRADPADYPIGTVRGGCAKIAGMEPATDPTPVEASITQANEMALLVAGCKQMGIALDASQQAQFEQYYRDLVSWNERLNLTTITGYDEVQIKHFLDSLVSLPLIAAELGQALPLGKPLRLVDVGSGAGFPGLPLKIASPSLDVTLMDGTQKKVHFLQQVADTLQLAPVQVIHGRAEELGRKSEHRDRYDLVTARAVAPLNVLAEYLLPLVRPGGLAVIYKGPGAPQEFMEARQAIKLLAGDAVRLAPVEVPFLQEKRFVLLVKKVRPTPSQYPRGQGLARKKPL